MQKKALHVAWLGVANAYSSVTKELLENILLSYFIHLVYHNYVLAYYTDLRMKIHDGFETCLHTV